MLHLVTTIWKHLWSPKVTYVTDLVLFIIFPPQSDDTRKFDEPLILTYVCNACYAVHFPLHALLRVTPGIHPFIYHRYLANPHYSDHQHRRRRRRRHHHHHHHHHEDKYGYGSIPINTIFGMHIHSNHHWNSNFPRFWMIS